MQHPIILHKSLQNVIHGKRLNTLKQMVSASFRAQSLTVTQLGRSLSSSNSERSGIRKADRFLSNEKIHAEYPVIC